MMKPQGKSAVSLAPIFTPAGRPPTARRTPADYGFAANPQLSRCLDQLLIWRIAGSAECRRAVVRKYRGQTYSALPCGAHHGLSR